MVKKILIIDDEENSRIPVVDILEEQGYAVIQASSAEEGIDKARNENPDVVLLDTMLPKMGGLKACCQIKQVEKLPCKVIVYTGKVEAVDLEEASSCGADYYFVKGSDPVILLATIRKLL